MPTVLTKYLQRKIDGLKWPQLLVFHDKHYKAYYLLKDQEALGRAFLDMLKIRMSPELAYIYKPEPENKIYGIKEELTQEVAESLPEPYRTQALQVRKENEGLRRRWAEQMEEYATAKKALKEKDGMLAFMILHDRNGREYEKFDFEDLTIP